MASDAFAGSTLKFEDANPPTTVVGDIVDMSFSENGNPVDVTDASDTLHKFLAGVANSELTITVYGIPTQAIGDIGQILVEWNDDTDDGTDDQHFVIVNKTRSANVGGAITTAVTFQPSDYVPA